MENDLAFGAPREAKTLVLERTDTHQSHIVESEIDMTKKCFNIKAIINKHCSLKNHHISLYNPNSCQFEPLSRIGAADGNVPVSILEPHFIFIRFLKKKQSTHSDSASSPTENH